MGDLFLGNGGSMKSPSLVRVLVFLVACFPGSVSAQTHEKQDEIPIERCGRLSVVTMKVAEENRRFLLDTGATTILNLKFFTSCESKQIHIYSWSGSAATNAREVFLPQVELGTHRLHDLKLPAIDLSPIGKACGGQIDGILGVDLLDQMGMTIDLKRRVAVPAPVGEPEDSADAFLHDVYHVSPCKPARQRSSSAKATALKTVRTACNRFQRAGSSATRSLCKSSVGSSNCLLVAE